MSVSSARASVAREEPGQAPLNPIRREEANDYYDFHRKVFAQISISLYLEPVLVREIFASDPKIMSRDSVKKPTKIFLGHAHEIAKVLSRKYLFYEGTYGGQSDDFTRTLQAIVSASMHDERATRREWDASGNVKNAF